MKEKTGFKQNMQLIIIILEDQTSQQFDCYTACVGIEISATGRENGRENKSTHWVNDTIVAFCIGCYYWYTLS